MLKKFLFVSALSALAATACSQAKNERSVLKFKAAQRSELAATPVTRPYDVTSVTTNPQRSAEILGIVTAAAPATTGNCTKCHAEFRTSDGLTNLYNATYYPYLCLRGDLNTDATKQTAIQCLAKLSGSLSTSDKDNIDAGDLTTIKSALNDLGPSDLGLFAAALPLSSFKNLFTGSYASLLTSGSWVKNATMPKSGAAMTEADFQTALAWVMRKTPQKERFLTHDGPSVCNSASETFIGAGIKAHVKNMSEDGNGWNFRNQANGLKMFGCDASGCFKGKQNGADIFPVVSGLLKTSGEVRALYTLDEKSTYWTRSSADGRYVAYGAKPESTIIDLAPKLTGATPRKIKVEADYDPSFTPDNLNFIFQGDAHGSRICHQSMLASTSLTNIDFNSASCSSSNLKIGLYQAFASNLDTGDMVTISGGFKSDEGATLVQDTVPFFDEDSSIDIVRIAQSESTVFQKVSTTTVPTPFIANWMVSPSSQMAVGTVSAATSQQKARHGGYRIVLTDDVAQAKALPTSLTDANTASLCVMSGEKPQFSYDERYLVYYAYETHAEVVKAADSSANLYVIDLLGDGAPVQLTDLPKGSFAQFPHFRSDGWLYFSLYNSVAGTRQVVATDAILNLSK